MHAIFAKTYSWIMRACMGWVAMMRDKIACDPDMHVGERVLLLGWLDSMTPAVASFVNLVYLFCMLGMFFAFMFVLFEVVSWVL